jgi:hypothetical protein
MAAPPDGASTRSADVANGAVADRREHSDLMPSVRLCCRIGNGRWPLYGGVRHVALPAFRTPERRAGTFLLADSAPSRLAARTAIRHLTISAHEHEIRPTRTLTSSTALRIHDQRPIFWIGFASDTV